ncbi:MAG: helix-turn-helix domain-containing protein [Archangium sp.]
MATTSTDRIWRVSEVAQYLSMSVSWVYKAAEAGEIPCFRIGASLRFSSRAIKKFVESLKPGA